MSLHHLDPREASTGAAPDVETVYDPPSCGDNHPWYAQRFPQTNRIEDETLPYDTEAAALAAARQAAGFGHVAEHACAKWTDPRHGIDSNRECLTCAWPPEAHKRR